MTAAPQRPEIREFRPSTPPVKPKAKASPQGQHSKPHGKPQQKRPLVAPDPVIRWNGKPFEVEAIAQMGLTELRNLEFHLTATQCRARSDRALMVKEAGPAGISQCDSEAFAAVIGVVGLSRELIHNRRRELLRGEEQSLGDAFVQAAKEVLKPADFAGILKLAELRRTPTARLLED